MNTSLKVLMRCIRTGWIVDSLRILALKIRGENRMDRAAVNMTRIPVMMICFRMDMEERNHEHPRGQPEHGKYTNSCHAQLPLFNLCNLRRNLGYTTWVAGASFNASLLVVGPENPENEPVLGRHTLRHEMEASSLQETSFAVLISC
jgi:hypothetical protein